MTVRSVVFDIIGKDNLSPAALKAAASVDTAAGRIEAAGKRVSAAGALASKAVTAPVLAAAAVSLKMAGDFQQNTNVLVTAAGELPKNLAAVRKGILDTATGTGTAWKDVTAGVYVAEKAGYRGAAAIELVRAAAQGAREEGAQLSTVLQAQTSIMASYHIPAAKSVQVVNEMKTAAGEAKTTMELFSGSLSTVLPLASANKISFADIAGSLASLTQHGTSADEAAQELAFTMRGLAAPNAVAQKEMAQLGISSVDVATKLGDGPGGRGLAGTLKYLSDVVRSRTRKDGTILLSTLNASKIAAHDAQIEFNTLPAAVQKVARQFMAGTITMGAWNKYIKSLPADQNVLARQFAVTENNARGFQQQLRNGISIVQTSSDALKKMTGGANGLNTVLQLTGHSMEGTNHRIETIAKSAADTGKNVQGWASTQKLFNVQLDMAKQQLDRIFITVGTNLIPVVSKLFGWIQSGVKWFDDLNSSQKTTIGIMVGVAAAIGPVTWIVGKLISGFGLLVRLSSSVVDFGAKVVGAMTTSTGAILAENLAVEASNKAQLASFASSAAAIATAEAEKANAAAEGAVEYAAATESRGAADVALTRIIAENAIEQAASYQTIARAAEATAARTAEASAAAAAAATAAAAEVETAGAAAGEAASVGFGPVGIAIGAVVGVGALAAHALGLFGSSAKHQIKPTDDFTQAILRDNGALAANTREQVKNKLEKDGAYDAALKLGISQKTLTDAMLGNKAALAAVAAAQRAAEFGSLTGLGTTDAQSKKARDLAKANRDLTAAIGDVSTTLAVNERAATNLAAADGKTLTGLNRTKKAFDASANAAEHATKVSNALVTTLGKLGIKYTINLDTKAAVNKISTLETHVNDLYTALLGGKPAPKAPAAPPGSGLGGLVGVPGHAGGGSVSDGWFTSGENGVELGYKQGSSVKFFSAPQTQRMGGGRGHVTIHKQELHVHYPEPGGLTEALPNLMRVAAAQLDAP